MILRDLSQLHAKQILFTVILNVSQLESQLVTRKKNLEDVRTPAKIR